MIAEGFVSYRGFRWLWLNMALVGFCVYLYMTQGVGVFPNGRTPLGYTLGVLSAGIIVVLMWFGIRKRSYNNRFTTLKGCLAAHIWLGVALVFLVPLHSGFQFGWNIHTLAYVLMLLTIASGILGVIIYSRYPQKVISHRGGGSVKTVVERLAKLGQEIEFLAKDRSDDFLRFLDVLDVPYEPNVFRCLVGGAPRPRRPEEVAKLMVPIPQEEKDEARELIQLIDEKHNLFRQMQNDIRFLALFRSWLYLHVPLSVGLVAALVAHIVVVSLYRW